MWPSPLETWASAVHLEHTCIHILIQPTKPLASSQYHQLANKPTLLKNSKSILKDCKSMDAEWCLAWVDPSLAMSLLPMNIPRHIAVAVTMKYDHYIELTLNSNHTNNEHMHTCMCILLYETNSMSTSYQNFRIWNYMIYNSMGF